MYGNEHVSNGGIRDFVDRKGVLRIHRYSDMRDEGAFRHGFGRVLRASPRKFLKSRRSKSDSAADDLINDLRA